MTYGQALTSGVQLAKIGQQAVVVKYWRISKDFDSCFLTSAVQVGAWDVSTIVASIDHKGNVTEGDWIKETLAKGIEVI
jgi:hypothetical protein